MPHRETTFFFGFSDFIVIFLKIQQKSIISKT